MFSKRHLCLRIIVEKIFLFDCFVTCPHPEPVSIAKGVGFADWVSLTHMLNPVSKDSFLETCFHKRKLTIVEKKEWMLRRQPIQQWFRGVTRLF